MIGTTTGEGENELFKLYLTTELQLETVKESVKDNQVDISHMKISILSLNVNGLSSKLGVPEFVEYVSKYDILCFQETKLDCFDQIAIPDYILPFRQDRKKFKSRSGGTAVFVKKYLKEFVTELHGSCELVKWFKLHMHTTTIVCGCIYLPPEGSNYAEVNCFDSIEEDILNLCSTESICLMGDFNARTSVLKDYIVIEPLIYDQLNMNNDRDGNLSSVGMLEQLMVPLERSSKDETNNNFGFKLIELCKKTGINIVNGRMCKDKDVGDLTCDRKSMVDYMIVSPQMFAYITDFGIEDFNPLFSDKHSPVIAELCLSTGSRGVNANNLPSGGIDVDGTCIHASESEGSVENKGKMYKWKEDCKGEFMKGINDNCIKDIEAIIDRLSDRNSVIREDIEHVNNSIAGLFDNSAKVSGMVKKINDNSASTAVYNTNKLAGYDNVSRQKKQCYENARRMYRSNKSVESLQYLKKCSKVYKKEINKLHRNSQKKFVAKIRDLKSNNPKEYWNIIGNKNSGKGDLVDIGFEVLTEHFKALNNSVGQNDNYQTPRGEMANVMLNSEFTLEELGLVVRKMKQGKAAGADGIINEFIKSTFEKLKNVYCKLFNLILKVGVVPEVWTIGFIVPLYKNKGSKGDPDNYRGITLMSCMGKFFTSALNNRLTNYIEAFGVLEDNQSAFRKENSTTDHIFTLHQLIELYLHKKKRVYAAFIDYRKAFDSVNRVALWQKLIGYEINGQFLKIIQDMYNTAKSHVKVNGHLSQAFGCNIGVRQGENLSPVLFTLFLNDLEAFVARSYNGMSTFSDMVSGVLETDEIVIYVNLYLLLYADDTILLAEGEGELQAALNGMNHYCNTWKLKINAAKSKIVVFSRGKIKKIPVFKLGEDRIEVVTQYSYLGVMFNYNNRFHEAVQKQYNQASRAMFSLISKIRKFGLPVDVSLDLFDKLITPIVLYGSEVWGFTGENIYCKLHLQFCRLLLRAGKSTPACMIYGELGVVSLSYYVNSRMLNYWFKLVTGKTNKLACLMYRLIRKLDKDKAYTSNWLQHIKVILNQANLYNVWIGQDNCNMDIKKFKCVAKCRLKECFTTRWQNDIDTCKKNTFYKYTKLGLNCEKYILTLTPLLRVPLCRFRLSNHNLPIEKGRHMGLTREDRKCLKCTTGDIGDEFHYLFVCHFFDEKRRELLSHHYYRHPSMKKMCDLFNVRNSKKIVKLAKFCKHIVGNI